MKTAIVYLHVVGRSDPSAPPPSHYDKWHRRFMDSWRKWELGRGADHDLIIMECGRPQTTALDPDLFKGVDDRFLYYEGGGWDIGAHQFGLLQLKLDYDLVINMATPTYFWRTGFVAAMRHAFETHGDGLYGATASYEISPHIRTCCWACRPATFAEYPHLVQTREMTFRAESGDLSITRWFRNQCKPVMLVTPSGCYEESQWRNPPGVFRRGLQTNCYVWDRHSDIYAEATLEERTRLEKLADGK